MAESLVIICVLIGFLSGPVTNHPTKRRNYNSQYHLPKPLYASDAFDIKLINTNFFVIRLVTDNDKTVYSFTVKLHDDINAQDQREKKDCEFLLKTRYNKFIENSTVAIYFTVRNNMSTGTTNIISIGGPTGVLENITIKDDYDIEDIKYLTVTGKSGDDIKLLELKFKYS